LNVEGVEFGEEVGPLVQRVVAEARAVGGPDCVYAVQMPELRAAVFPAAEDNDGMGVFVRIAPRDYGATVWLNKRMKGKEPRRLNEDTIEAIIADIPVRYRTVRDAMTRDGGKAKNPKWTTEEIILALELYFKTPPWTANKDHASVLELSQTLNRLSAYADAPDKLRYRNPNGVYMKLMNLQYLDPSRNGRGLKAGGRAEAEVWANYANDPVKLQSTADAIRRTIDLPELRSEEPPEDTDITEAAEGRQLTRLHGIRERDGALRKSKVKSVLKTTGRLDCEGCGFNFRHHYGDHAGDYIEVHHLTPLAELPVRNTSLADLALVCANCHRMIHRRSEWLSLDDLKAILRRNDIGVVQL
jgi:5-methylcytosine-specific restriction protein A